MTNHHNDAYGRRDEAQRQPRREYSDRDDRPQSEFDRSAHSRDENEGGRYRDAAPGRGRNDDDRRDSYPGSEYAGRNTYRPTDSQREDPNGWPSPGYRPEGAPYEGAARYGTNRSSTGQNYGSGPQPGNGGQRSEQGYGSQGYGSQGSGSQGYRSRGQSGEYGVTESDYSRESRPSYGRDRSQPGAGGMNQSEWGFDQGSNASTQARGSAPKGYTRSDDRIKEDLSERFMSSSGVDASDIEIEVKEGEVTLKGTVASRNHKFQAEQIAESILGVKDVNNQLRLKRSDDRDTSRSSTRESSQSSSSPQQASAGTSAGTSSGRRS